MKINNLRIVGGIFNEDGYSSHIRSLSTALNKHIPVQIECDKPEGWASNVDKETYEMLNRDFGEDTVNIMIGMPPYWEFALSNNPKRFIGFLVWEGDKIPSFWTPICNDERVSQVWVPSEHTKKACIKSGVDENKIFVVSHGVNLDKFKILDSKKDNDIFDILYCKGWRGGMHDRSGFEILARAYQKAFKKKDKVCLTAKFNQAYIPQGWDVGKELEDIGIDLEKCAPMKLISENIPFDDLVGIYNMADIMVVPTKGEGFGLTMAEAMSCKLPCITSDFGGQTDFVNNENGWLLKTKLKPATGGVMYEECKWGFANEDELTKLLKRLYNNRKEVKEKGEQALKDIQKWTWERSAKLAMNALVKLK